MTIYALFAGVRWLVCFFDKLIGYRVRPLHSDWSVGIFTLNLRYDYTRIIMIACITEKMAVTVMEMMSSCHNLPSVTEN